MTVIKEIYVLFIRDKWSSFRFSKYPAPFIEPILQLPNKYSMERAALWNGKIPK